MPLLSICRSIGMAENLRSKGDSLGSFPMHVQSSTTMLRRFDPVQPPDQFISHRDGLRVEAPRAHWLRRPFESTHGPETSIRPLAVGLKDRGPSENRSPSEPHAARRTIVQWQAEYGLTASEFDVLDFVSRGMRLAVIARERNTSLGTARTRLKSIFDKTGFRSQQAILTALLKGPDRK